jgi:phosphate transport system substrate-binding protein
MSTKRMACGWICLIGVALVAGCSKGGTEGAKHERKTVKLDGSSTVAPISMVAAEMFQDEHPDIRVTVGISGTGGGFKKFLSDSADLRTDINDASRPIKPAELERAKKLGVQFIELPLGIDGIAVVVHPDNKFCDYLTVAELKRMWEPGSKINNWKQVREGFPDMPLKLYGPGTDSGTFDYFTEAIMGESKVSRSDFTMSEDDNVLVQGVHGDVGGLGYFGFSYYEANMDKLKLLAIDDNVGKPIKPSLAVIRSGAYKPLSRPLFLYVNVAATERPEVMSFLDFYLTNARKIVEHPRVKYVALPNELYSTAMARLKNKVLGSAMAKVDTHGSIDLAKVYAAH